MQNANGIAEIESRLDPLVGRPVHRDTVVRTQCGDTP